MLNFTEIKRIISVLFWNATYSRLAPDVNVDGQRTSIISDTKSGLALLCRIRCMLQVVLYLKQANRSNNNMVKFNIVLPVRSQVSPSDCTR